MVLTVPGWLFTVRSDEGILDYDRFMSEIEPLLITQTYASPGPTPMTCLACHGDVSNAASSTFTLTAGQHRANFIQVARYVQITQPDTSPILLKPLSIAAGGVPHGLPGNDGGKQFLNTTTDPAYLEIFEWIADATRANGGARVVRTEPYPNPFRSNTNIVYFLSTDALDAEVKIFTEGGREVRRFPGTTNVGANRVNWNGRDEENGPLPTGVYFYLVKVQFRDGTGTKTGRCVYTP